VADSAYRKAIDLLARRPHFEAELRAKLRKRSFEEVEISAAIEELRSAGYVDDLESARVFVRSRLRRSPDGRTKLRADLLRRGASSADAEAALADHKLPTETEIARRAAERWQLRGGHDRAALLRHLDRRGFSKSDILKVVDELSESAAEPQV